MIDRTSRSQEPLQSIAVHTRESDEDDDAEEGSSITDSDVVDEPDEQTGVADHDDLQEGMLPRDLPKRTTFYDPVAERQMTQTDAKLFYQRSKIESRAGGSTWSHATPIGSPIAVSASQPATEYGADSLVLDHEGTSLQNNVGATWFL
jgi:AMP deaminase